MKEIVAPDLVQRRALAAGAAGELWLRQLPRIIESIADAWLLELGVVLPGGTAALVVAAKRVDGSDCVVKVGMPFESDAHGAFGRAAAVHRLAAGRGCARLIEFEPRVPAMLLERLGANLGTSDVPLERLMVAVVTALHDFWRPVDSSVALPSGADKASWLASHLVTTWDRLGRPCERSLIDRAVALCDERASRFIPAEAVLVHGDAHGWNTLEAGPGSYKLVDPEGLWSQREHDLGVLMREYNVPLLEGDTPRLVSERAEHLARIAGDLDAEAVWQWGFIERVSTGLAALEHFGRVEADPFLEVATRVM